MPQVDHLTFFPQAFWGLLLFLSFFFFFSKWGVSTVKNNITVRFLNILKKKEFARSSFFYVIFYNIQTSCKSLVIYNFIKNYLKKNLFNLTYWSLIWSTKGQNEIKNFKSLPILANIKNQVFWILLHVFN